MCRVFVTGLPFMPAAATIVMGVLLGVALYGAHLWAGMALAPLEPPRAEAHTISIDEPTIVSHRNHTIFLHFNNAHRETFGLSRFQFRGNGQTTAWQDGILSGDFGERSIPKSLGHSPLIAVQSCLATDITIDEDVSECSGGWHSEHEVTFTINFVEDPVVNSWDVSPDGTVLETDNIGFSYRATNSDRIVITRNNLDYISGLDGNGDLIVATVNPHIRNLNVDTHTFRLTAYRFVSETNEELSTESPDVFTVIVRAGVTPPTPTRTRTPTRTYTHTPTIVGVPDVPDLSGLEVVCSLTGSNNQTLAIATWNAPSGTLPTGVSRTGYSVTWSNLDDLESPTETMIVTTTSAMQRSGYGYGDLAFVRVLVVYSWTGSSEAIYTTGQFDTCGIPTPGVTPGTPTPSSTSVPPGVTPPTATRTPTSRPTTRVPLPLVVRNIRATCNYPDVTVTWDAFQGSFDNYRVRYRRYNLDDYIIESGRLPTGYYQIHGAGTDNSITIRNLNNVGYRARDENYESVQGNIVRRDLFRVSVQIESGGESTEWFSGSSCVFTPPEGPPISGLHFSDCSTGRTVTVEWRMADPPSDTRFSLAGYYASWTLRNRGGTTRQGDRTFSSTRVTADLSDSDVRLIRNAGFSIGTRISIPYTSRPSSTTTLIFNTGPRSSVSCTTTDDPATALPPAATSAAPVGPCEDPYYRITWNRQDIINVSPSGGQGSNYLRNEIRYTVDLVPYTRTTTTTATGYTVQGVGQAGYTIIWRVYGVWLVGGDVGESDSEVSRLASSGTGLMQACPTGPTDPPVCQPPLNMTFNRYNDFSRVISFDFDAPVADGLTRLHYQPQYRRLPGTTWFDASFTVLATRTSWAIIFNNESYTPGRTIEFRLLSICTGDVRSAPSNVVSYTYPGATPTPSSTFSGPSPTPTMTMGPSPTSASCPVPTNLRFTRFSNSNVSIRWNGVDVDLPTAFISISPNPSNEGDDVRIILRTEYATYWALYWDGVVLADSNDVSGQLDYDRVFEDVEYTTGRTDIRVLARNDIGEDEATESWIVNQRPDCLAPTNFRRGGLERDGALGTRVSYRWDINPVSDSVTTAFVFQFRNTTGNTAGDAWRRFNRSRTSRLATWGATTSREGQTWEFRVITICGEEESPPTAILSQTWAHPPRSPSFVVCTDARVELSWSRPTTQSYFTLLRYEIEFYTDSAYTVQRRSPISSTADISGSSSWRAWTGAYNAGETAYMLDFAQKLDKL